ncbi:MAG: MarR family winged helix-turn-helix transcriptional regulator [Paraclostridium sp.]
MVKNIIDFISKTFPKIYSSLYLEYLKQYTSDNNINRTQLRALVFIKKNGDIAMSELCERLNIEKGSLTTVVDDLTRKGYITRSKDNKDRRKYILSITEDGDAIASDFIKKLEKKLEEKFLKLDKEEHTEFMNSINTLERILNKPEFN